VHKCRNYTKLKKGEPNLEKLKNCLDNGGHYRHPKCEFYRGREVIINLKDAKGAAIAQVDGEELLKFPLRFGIEPQALQVIVPKPCMAR